MNSSSFKSIGIVRFSALGDVVWTLPLIDRILKSKSYDKVYLFVDPLFASLAQNIPGLTVVSIKKPKKISDYLKIKKQLKDYNLDTLICTQTSFRINLVYPLIKAQRKIGLDSTRSKDLHSLFINEKINLKKEHALETMLSFADHLNLPSCPMSYNIHIPATDTNWAQDIIKNKATLVVHGKASSEQRTWAPEKYAQVIDQCKFNQIILTGVPADQAFVNQIQSLCTKPLINLCGKTSLLQLTALLKAATALLCPDSGPAHIASAVGCPTVGLYAALPPSYTGPYHHQALCINVYEQALKELLKKDPRNTKWMTRVHHSELMSLITVASVLNQVDPLYPG